MLEQILHITSMRARFAFLFVMLYKDVNMQASVLFSCLFSNIYPRTSVRNCSPSLSYFLLYLYQSYRIPHASLQRSAYDVAVCFNVRVVFQYYTHTLRFAGAITLTLSSYLFFLWVFLALVPCSGNRIFTALFINLETMILLGLLHGDLAVIQYDTCVRMWVL